MKFSDYLVINQETILLIIFGISLLIQLIYYLFIYSRFIFRKIPEFNQNDQPVTVIICARNEAENLEKNLPSVLSQEYPVYEVVVVNDCSSDNTDEILGKFLKKYSHLRTTGIVEDKKFTHGKKLAITVGIKAAKNEILIFTDADCQPVSNQWIKNIQRHFTGEKSIVLGYGGYFEKKSLLNNYIRYDTLVIAIQYFSYALIGKPYMGVGRNLAYKKSFFFANKGFGNHYHLLSGDDDLFVNENANKLNIDIEFSSASHTRSEPETNPSDWIKQKRRHLTTAAYYKPSHKFMLGLEPLSRVFYYAAFTWLVVLGPYLPVILSAFGFRLIIQMLFTKKAMQRLKEKNLLLSSLFFDIFSLLINFSLYISNRFGIKHKKWK